MGGTYNDYIFNGICYVFKMEYLEMSSGTRTDVVARDVKIPPNIYIDFNLKRKKRETM